MRNPIALLAMTAMLVAGLLPAAPALANYQQQIDLTFPTVASAVYRDDFDAGRVGGRWHRAIDLHAPTGTPVYAAVGGTVDWVATGHGAAGHGLRVRGTDGRVYAYYHLGAYGSAPEEAYASGIRLGVPVRRGQLLGWLGDSGNAVGGSPHLHFEVHDARVTDPYGSNRMNPYTSLVAAQRRGDYGTAVAGSAASATSGVLRLGARGEAVASWQRALATALGRPLPADGVFGPVTDSATRALQRHRGIAVDGIVGPATRAAAASTPQRATSAPGGLLEVGARGPDVGEWQRELSAALGRQIHADGIFATATLQATLELQRSSGITADGIVGPRTRAAAAAAAR